MVLRHNGFLTFILFGAYHTTARLGAGLTDMRQPDAVESSRADLDQRRVR
jgi:hypothetical protein